jgi:hypothetical protein
VILEFGLIRLQISDCGLRIEKRYKTEDGIWNSACDELSRVEGGTRKAKCEKDKGGKLGAWEGSD